MKKWLITLMQSCLTKDVLAALIEWLEEQAKKSENTLDDAAVSIVKTVLNTAFPDGKTTT